MNRRGFLGRLASVAAIPFIRLKRPCEHTFNPLTKCCDKCGITIREIWLKAAKNMKFIPRAEPQFRFYTNYPAMDKLQELDF